MKLIQTIHRASGHSARVYQCLQTGLFVACYYYKNEETGTDSRYSSRDKQDCIETAQLELMILQDQD